MRMHKYVHFSEGILIDFPFIGIGSSKLLWGGATIANSSLAPIQVASPDYHMYIHTYIHTLQVIHTHIHTYIYTYIHTSLLGGLPPQWNSWRGQAPLIPMPMSLTLLV